MTIKLPLCDRPGLNKGKGKTGKVLLTRTFGRLSAYFCHPFVLSEAVGIVMAGLTTLSHVLNPPRSVDDVLGGEKD